MHIASSKVKTLDKKDHIETDLTGMFRVSEEPKKAAKK